MAKKGKTNTSTPKQESTRKVSKKAKGTAIDKKKLGKLHGGTEYSTSQMIQFLDGVG